MIRTILCPIDFTPVSERELELAVRLAHRFDAEIIVQHNVTRGAGLGVSWMHQKEHHAEDEARDGQAQERLSAIVARLDTMVNTKAGGVVTYGALDHCVQELARQTSADLIVIGTHDRASADHPSETERLITSAPCPVLTTHDDAPERWLPDVGAATAKDPIHTLVPMDFSAHSVAALRYALDLLDALPLEITALHVARSEEHDQEWVEAELAKAVPAERTSSVRIEVRRGAPVDRILLEESMLEAHLAIMGAHAKGFVERLLARGASTAREVLHRSSCPVWFVPAG